MSGDEREAERMARMVARSIARGEVPVSGDEHGHTSEAHTSAAEILREIRANPDGPIAQKVREAREASAKFQREWDAIRRMIHSEADAIKRMTGREAGQVAPALIRAEATVRDQDAGVAIRRGEASA